MVHRFKAMIQWQAQRQCCAYPLMDGLDMLFMFYYFTRYTNILSRYPLYGLRHNPEILLQDTFQSSTPDVKTSLPYPAVVEDWLMGRVSLT